MNNLLTDPANHPANGPLTVERIARVRDELQRTLWYKNGSTQDYVTADAIKALDELLERRKDATEPVADVVAWSSPNEERTCDIRWRRFDVAPGPLYTAPPGPQSSKMSGIMPDYEGVAMTQRECYMAGKESGLAEARKSPVLAVPETLPCPVFLEPGLHFGKGVKTQLLFDALKRRAEYYAELDAMTPEQRAEHDAGIAEFKAMLSGNSPATTDCWCRTCRPVTMTEMRFVVCPDCGNKRCPHANDHRNACTGSNEPGQEGGAYPAAPPISIKPSPLLDSSHENVKLNSGWIPVSERMPKYGDYLVSDGHDFDVQLFNGEQFIPGFVWETKITHWQPLPAAPQEVK